MHCRSGAKKDPLFDLPHSICRSGTKKDLLLDLPHSIRLYTPIGSKAWRPIGRSRRSGRRFGVFSAMNAERVEGFVCFRPCTPTGSKVWRFFSHLRRLGRWFSVFSAIYADWVQGLASSRPFTLIGSKVCRLPGHLRRLGRTVRPFPTTVQRALCTLKSASRTCRFPSARSDLLSSRCGPGFSRHRPKHQCALSRSH